MTLSKPLHTPRSSLVSQVLAVMIQDQPLDARLAPSSGPLWSACAVSDVLRSIPRFFFQSARSIGRQNGFRHQAPLKRRSLGLEACQARRNLLIHGPAANRDPRKVRLGLTKALEFYGWVESRFGFAHCESTCREMACVLARGNRLDVLWKFLKLMSRRRKDGLVTTATVTCLIKVLGEEGLVNHALTLFSQMRRFYCKPDVHAYNTILFALCRVGNFKRARLLLQQMELPGFRCPADTFTYTILISSYCKYSLQTRCKKAIMKRMWEANHLFRIMLFKGFVPDTVTYNSLIDGCCKTNRIGRALELFDDMNKRGCLPNRVTYNSFIRYYSAVNEIDKAMEMLRKMERMKHGIPTSSSYTPIIHALCEVGSVLEARDLMIELVDGGSVPREYTYMLVCNALKSLPENNMLDEKLRRRIEVGIGDRYKSLMKVKPIMNRTDRKSVV